MREVRIISDIEMCKNDNCKKAQNCLRFLAKPDKFQNYIYSIEEICNENNEYDYFIEVKRLGRVV